MESFGNRNAFSEGKKIGYDSSCMGSTLHWGPSWQINRYDFTHASKCLQEGKSFADEFHHFELFWTEDYIRTFVDGELVLNVQRGQGDFTADNLWEYGNFKDEALPYKFDENIWKAGSHRKGRVMVRMTLFFVVIWSLKSTNKF